MSPLRKPYPSDVSDEEWSLVAPYLVYCVKCRVPKRPACDMVDYVARSPTTGTLQGICPTCESMIYRALKHADLDAVCGGLIVSHRGKQQ